ncbi:MAG: hypothetical protein EBQ96_03395 [Proteobacteria bacterium]|nr:hypothetical protein [Pseudomonadota bacterium]
MEITELGILDSRHKNEERLLLIAIGAAEAMAKGEIPEKELALFSDTHFSSINTRSPADIEEEAYHNYGSNIGAYAEACLDFLKLEKQRPYLQRVRMIFGLFAEDQHLYVADERHQIALNFQSQYEEAMWRLEDYGFDRPDLKDQFNAIMAGPHNKAWTLIKTEELARLHELNFLARISDAHMGQLRFLRRLNESEMAKTWLLHKARRAQRGIVAFDEAKSRKAMKAEGRRSAVDLKALHPHIGMNGVTVDRYAQKYDRVRRMKRADKDGGSLHLM